MGPTSTPTPEGGPQIAPSEGGAQPHVEQAPASPTPETQAGSAEGANQNSGMILPPPVPVAPPPAITTPVDPAAPQPTMIGAPASADEVDVIEKEWVDKAKSIVNQTREDPYQQKRQVSALKSDYLKKRYGKELRPADNS